jgi:hypothetical protein
MAQPALRAVSAPAPAITSAIRPVVPGCNYDLIILGIICRVGGSIAVAIGGIAPIAVTVASAAAAGAGRLYDDGSGRVAAVSAAAGSGRLSADVESETRSEEQQSRDAAIIEYTPGLKFFLLTRRTA